MSITARHNRHRAITAVLYYNSDKNLKESWFIKMETVKYNIGSGEVTATVKDGKYLYYWQGGINEMIKRVLNGKRTLQQAFEYIQQNYTGDTKTAFNHVAFNTTTDDAFIELEFKDMLKHAIKSGYGKDYNFEKAYR